MLAGSLASICTGAIISVSSTLIWPDNYDWAETRALGAPSSIVEITSEEQIPDLEGKTTSPDSVDSEKASRPEATSSLVEPDGQSRLEVQSGSVAILT